MASQSVAVDRKDLGVNELPTVASPVQHSEEREGSQVSHDHENEKAAHSDHDVESGGDVEADREGDRNADAFLVGGVLALPLIAARKISVLGHSRYTVWFRDIVLIAVILGWWIVAIINDRPQVRHRWIPSTITAWFFILLILLHKSRYIPQRPFVRAISTVWDAVAAKPWSLIPHKGKVAIGWTCLLVLLFGTTYGLPENETSTRAQRTISLVGLGLIYGGMFLFSHNHKAVQARTTIIGIGLQFIIGLFVFRTDAGYDLFKWLSFAASDLLSQAQAPTGAYSIGGGAEFFWSADFVSNHYFFVNTLASIVWFVALCISLFYLGALSWAIRKFAWLFFHLFGISGAEAVVAVASPFIGQGENCVLVRPFVKTFTRSEFHQVLTSGFGAIAGSVFIAYVDLGVSGKDLITSSVMSIPAAIAASKLVYPETEESDTKGRIVIDRSEDEREANTSFFQALSNGAWFGLKVAGLILANVLVLVTFITTLNGILAYIGNALYITDSNGPLTIQLILGYILWPLTFMLGVPKADTLEVSKLIAIKVVANEFVGYTQLQTVYKPLLSPRGYLIAKYALCGFANIASQGINIGILSAMAPKRSKDIIRLTPSALVTGALVTLSSAAIAGIVADTSAVTE